MIQPTAGTTDISKQSQVIAAAISDSKGTAARGEQENLLQEFSSILDKIASKLSAEHPDIQFTPEALSQAVERIRERRAERATESEDKNTEQQPQEQPLHTSPYIEEGEEVVEQEEKIQEVAEEAADEEIHEEELALDEGTTGDDPVADVKAQEVAPETDPTKQPIVEAPQLPVQQEAAQDAEQVVAQPTQTTQTTQTVRTETEQPLEQEAPQQQPRQASSEQPRITTQHDESPLEQIIKPAPQQQSVPEEVARFDAVALNNNQNGAQPTGEGEGNGILQRIVQLLMEREVKPELTTEQSQLQQQATANRDAMTAALIMRQALDVTTNIKGLEQSLQSNTVQQAGNSQRQDNAGGDTRSADTERSRSTKRQQTLTRSQVARTLEKVEAVLKEMSRSRDGKSISLRLDPPSLGNVRVDVTFRDGALHARVAAENPAVNQLLREKAQELQRSLRELGLNADTVSVSVGSESETNAGSNTGGNRSSSRNEDRSTQGNALWGTERGQEQSSGQMVIKPVVEDHWVA